MNNLITAGEFAKLASTTKRMILYYDEKGVLKPIKVNSAQYRFYLERQILDYQRILLLSTFGVSLGEMKRYLKKSGNLAKLFDDKKELIEKEIRLLEFNLQNLTKFQKNLKENGTMVNPMVQVMPPFGVFYIEKEGPYAKIGNYCEELHTMFENKGDHFTTLAIFEEQGYRPKKSRIKIGALKTEGMKLKKTYQDVVKYIEIHPGKVLTYTHSGSGSLLSLFWIELEKYCTLKKIKINKYVPYFEIYRTVNSDMTKQFFEIYLPIE
ncbi:MAG: Methyltransferase domain protein [Candidatus Roizmanbacteria bacterium GW2011_GWA2_37_7]|uniref:Methyltransferase domain protein n=1 Tax=Candidatus Roizmanbacteria bacterium GW2011_GWA2_37_7 TaxID=1618481 RepID=A0A0G0K7V1_9BACT|nr:MAG: Methyltransferase domain protein [Candidatus Roizmanbacteria bacterium GW2011_GWA2_37_7]